MTEAGSAETDYATSTTRPSPSLLAAEVRDRFRGALATAISLEDDDPDFSEMLQQSLDVVRQALDRFGSEGLAISFNGGKDACVVLYLLLMILAERDQVGLLCRRAHTGAADESGDVLKGIPVVYFQKEEFPELDDFMEGVAQSLGFEFRKYSMSYREGMEDLVDNQNIKAVIMGQRRGDPWTENMEHFTQSTPGWPEFTRVNPALEWKFHHVWRFLRAAHLSYCCLYDQGYTSLGERGDTQKNEALRLPNGQYRPAYTLAEEHLERSPRSPQPKVRGDSSPGDLDSAKSVHDRGARHLGRGHSSWDEKWDSWTRDEQGAALDAAEESSNRAGATANSAIVVAAPEAGGACVVSGRGQEKGGSWAAVGWMGGSARWLPLTALVLAILASIGFRRSGVPLKGN